MKYSDYAELCEAAYDGWKPFTLVDDLCFGVFTIQRKKLVVIRGTKPLELKNWLRDFSIWPINTPEGYYTHEGFYGAFRKLYNPVVSALYGAIDVEFTGHSLGGDIAELFAVSMNCKATTFGAAKNYYLGCKVPLVAHDRIICDDDIVPKLRIMGKHAVEPRLILTDNDGQKIQVQDHDIHIYYKRLEERGI